MEQIFKISNTYDTLKVTHNSIFYFNGKQEDQKFKY